MRKIGDGAQVKLGAVFSYILIIANTLYTLLITPMILEALGSSDYGVYKTVASLSSSLMVLDLGLGSTLMRYIANYRACHEEEKIEPFISMALLEAAILALLAGIVSSVFYLGIDTLYEKSFTPAEISLAKQLFLLLTINVILHIFENVFNGIITGYNNFVFGNGIKLGRIAARVALLFLVFFATKSAVTLVLIDLFLTALMAVAEVIYILVRYRLRPRFTRVSRNGGVFRESFIYTLLVFLSSIVSQVETNFSNVAIGALRGPELVTVYSFGLVILQMFKELSSAISGVLLPTVTRTLREEGGLDKVRVLTTRIGRIQFALLGAVVAGFVVIGKDFLALWLGEGFDDVYIIVLILMIPALFELCINTCLSILRAKNMLGFRTVVLCTSAVFNLIMTVIGVKYWGYMAAAVATAISGAIGSVVIMCMYYQKKFGFRMVRLYAAMFNRLWLCILIAGAATAVSHRLITGGWLAFALNVLVFGLVYIACILLFGFTREERHSFPIVCKLYKK